MLPILFLCRGHMSGSPFLKAALAITIITIVLFPLYAIFIEYPSFEKHIAENTTQEAVRIAKIGYLPGRLPEGAGGSISPL